MQACGNIPVLVSGVGASGVFIWHKLNRELIKKELPGGALLCKSLPSLGCSFHAQCVIHKGYTYNRFGEGFVSELSQAYKLWESLVEELEIPHKKGVVYCFSKETSASNFEKYIDLFRVRSDGSCFKLNADEDDPSTCPDPHFLKVLQRVDLNNLPQNTLGSSSTTLRHISKDYFQKGRAFVSDEMVIRPSVILSKLIEIGNEWVKDEISETLVPELHVSAHGRDEFSDFAPITFEADDEKMLVVVGKDLPEINAFFPSVCKLPKHLRGLVKESKKGEKRGTISIFSHKMDDNNCVWLILSNILTIEETLSQKSIKFLRDEISRFITGLSWTECVWKILDVKLPNLEHTEIPIGSRGIDRPPISVPVVMRAFGE